MMKLASLEAVDLREVVFKVLSFGVQRFDFNAEEGYALR